MNKSNDPVPKAVDSMEDTAMWEDGLAVPEGESSIGMTHSVENTTYV